MNKYILLKVNERNVHGFMQKIRKRFQHEKSQENKRDPMSYESELPVISVFPGCMALYNNTYNQDYNHVPMNEIHSLKNA